jgi:hypothetical protein
MRNICKAFWGNWNFRSNLMMKGEISKMDIFDFAIRKFLWGAKVLFKIVTFIFRIFTKKKSNPQAYNPQGPRDNRGN